MVATTTNLDIEPHRPGLDPFESATVTVFAGSCLTARDAIFGPDHLGLAARKLIRAQNDAKQFTVTLVGTWRCNRVDYTNIRFVVTPDAIGSHPDGYAYCRQQVDSQGGNRLLTDKARQTADELFAPYVLSAVQGQIDHIRDAMHKKVFEHLAYQCDEFRRSAKALERALRYQTKIAGPLVWTAKDPIREVEGWPC